MKARKPSRSAAGLRTRLGVEGLEAREVPAVFTVNNQLDIPIANKMNLRQAIVAANAAVNPPLGVDVITFSLLAANPDGSWLTNLTAPLPQITDGVTIDGLVAGMDRPVIQAFGLDARVFDIELVGAKVNDRVTFQTIYMAGGNTTSPNFVGADRHGAGIRSVGANLKVNDSRIYGCFSGGSGGGIYAIGPTTGSVEVSLSTRVYENTAQLSGGGIAVIGPSLEVGENVQITGNWAGRGGGGVYVAQSPTVVIRGANGRVFITGNTANDGSGGGVLIQTPAAVPGGGAPTIDLQTVTIADNKAYTGTNGLGMGGGIAVFGAFKVDADTQTFISNNGQSEAAPPAAPVLGVFMDPAILAGSTFWTNAVIFADNYQIL